MLETVLTVVMIVAGLLFVGSVLLMSPKGGLGMGLGGSSGGGMGDYGSKKSIENMLQKVAVVSVFVFIGAVLVLPYV